MAAAGAMAITAMQSSVRAPLAAEVSRPRPVRDWASGGKLCDLCLTEKLTILMADPRSTLNKRDEIMTKCKHKRKYLLGTVKPPEPDIEPVPPDPT